ncbi:hypothetical protein [Bacteroides acidifaciens]|jgi:hypothetical protein|uniref:hypothetical protein n=1 Tax=Bacteroides acidifaciens TaxID=85831 RepID=UPI00256FFBB5|nr:hypothetical protein [Bacteroides acidifaciens]
MKKFILTFIVMLTTMLVASAGTLSKWSLYDFQGTWEITSTDYDQNLNWLVNRFYGTYIGDPKIDKVELSLDYNGYGELKFYSGNLYGDIRICGALFIPHPELSCYECLSLLCTSAAYDPIKGLNSIYVYAISGDYNGKDKFAISSMNHLNNASAIKVSSTYDPTGAIAEIPATAMIVQYQAGGISIIDADGYPVAVYGIDGTLHYQTGSYQGETIRLNKDACYIIKAGDNSMKLTF